MKPNLGIMATGIAILFIAFSNLLAQTHHVDPWQPVSNPPSTAKRYEMYEDILKHYNRFYNSDSVNKYSALSDSVWHIVNEQNRVNSLKELKQKWDYKPKSNK